MKIPFHVRVRASNVDMVHTEKEKSVHGSWVEVTILRDVKYEKAPLLLCGRIACPFSDPPSKQKDFILTKEVAVEKKATLFTS